MSLATLPSASRTAAPVRPATPPAPAAPRVRAVPDGTEVRGFVLYVGVDEAKTAAAGTNLATLVDALRRLTAELVPGAQTHAAVALAPRGAGGRDVDVVRLALQDPSALAARSEDAPAQDVIQGVVIDLSRKRVLLDEETAPLTYKEFELLQYLVLREGRTVARAEIISSLWPDPDADAPNERTIDVHVRRLRSKLGDYQDIVRTVRGTGYRFDRHADVVVRHDLRGPSPDL
jgi:DNA-binding winged helix-turn-helix (wHTH) protein